MKPVVLAKSFSDVNQFNLSFVAIDFLSDRQVLNGYEDGTFHPDQPVNRAEALKIIYGSLYPNSSIAANDNGGQLFPDVSSSDWFFQYVWWFKNKGLVSGNADGTFAPSRVVSRAEFLKILLEGVGFKKDLWSGQQLFADVPVDSWFAPYLNYSGKSGLIDPDAQNNLYPQKNLSRAEVADIVYLMLIMVNSEDDQFLMAQALIQQNQIENYLGADDLVSAKRSADLAVNLTQQVLKIRPTDTAVLAKAKIAKAYDLLVGALVSAINQQYEEARGLAEQTINKANEAAQLDPDVADTASHLKEKAIEILNQIIGK